MTGLKLREGEFIILSKGSKNGYAIKQADIYEFQNHLYFKVGAWFIAIMKDGNTSRSDTRWKMANPPIERFDALGRAIL